MRPAIKISILKFGVVLLVFFSAAHAAPMQFKSIGGKYCRACDRWIQATGEITAETPDAFRQFLHEQEYYPKVVRFDSPGGDLVAGIELGVMLRELSFATQADRCLSACAYAFLGGTRRSFVDGSSLFGVHRFYNPEALSQPSLEQFTGKDLDGIQKLTAGLMLYIVEMGVDPRMLGLATGAGPDDMRFIDATEARELTIIFEPWKWEPWQLETTRDGLVATSKRNDGLAQMIVGCVQERGSYVSVTDRRENGRWFDQCSRSHNGLEVFGVPVPTGNAYVDVLEDGGASITFALPNPHSELTKPVLFYSGSMACRSGRYIGSTENFSETARMALRNCHR